MTQPYRLIVVACSLALVALVFELIRRERIKEELWAWWILIALVPMAASIWISPWATLAHWLGIRYEPALLLIIGLFFCVFLILHTSTIISRLMRQNQRLAQEVAYLTWRVERLGEGGALRADGDRAPRTPGGP
jgi:choline-glycine betaine transporter